MEEAEEILDAEVKVVKKAPIWPSVLLGGMAGGALLILFDWIMNHQLSVIISLIVSFIVLNSTLNFYRQRKNSTFDFTTSFAICYIAFIIMAGVFNMYKFLWVGSNVFLGDWISYSLPMVVLVTLAAGAAISFLAAGLSRKRV